MRVVVIEDHALLRAAIVDALYTSEELAAEVVGEAADAESGLVLVARHQPEVVVLDHHLPGRSGGAAIPDLRQRAPDATVILWTGSPNDTEVRALAASGVQVVAKDSGAAGLLAALRACIEER